MRRNAQRTEFALERLGVSASDAVAIEDSEPGARSALAAGLTTLVIGDERVAEHRGAHGFRSLTEVDIETLQRSLDVKPRP